ncbi:putative PEP-binding protein [Labrys monachus]|uniref:Phosphoenolpyruvate-protein phosphotransferase n=1 Tax=Labrys monachus TaxID=217067 RepID=A0ABU0FJD8_9HYPH|nr:putative PEP-binding protein [Labrys monachus]MDQ0394715.1 phosphotransferase system enzyme I (PtsI) [Labrys monachus]
MDLAPGHGGNGSSLPVERRLTGRPASPGLAAGPVFVDGPEIPAAAAPIGGDAEALRRAIGAAAAELAALAAGLGGEEADILGFQIAMLEDGALSEGAFDAISAGMPADHAWRSALDAEILDYEASEDPTFRARGADFADMRDRVLAHLAGTAGRRNVPAGSIYVAEDIAPSLFLSVDWSGGGIALAAGSPFSHVAMLARSRGVPMVTGLGRIDAAAAAIVDGAAGEVTLDPGAGSLAALAEGLAASRRAKAGEDALIRRPALLQDGTRIEVLLNVGRPEDLEGLDPGVCDGIGLVRTEFLFRPGHPLPGEDEQLAAYSRIAAWAEGRPVTIRTVDVGGDKPVEGLTAEGETNPFLGLRGLRLSLSRPEAFRVQLRALARAGAEHDIRVMLPMVTVPAEFDQAAALLDEEVAALARLGLPRRRPPLGIMVEVPAAALGAARFGADFYSIGSNDLTQYTMAAARDSAAVAGLNDTGDPAVLELMARTVAAGRTRHVPVSICGDAAADTGLLPQLLGIGLRCLSVAPMAVGRVKAAIAGLAHV